MPDSFTFAAEISTLLNIVTPSVLQPLCVDWADARQVSLYIKRDDLIHPIISGNKWRKLKYALLEAKQRGVAEIISFGGGHSNHLHALGYCCHQLGIQLLALVRGNYNANPTPMLRDLQQWHSRIIYLDKATYHKRSQPNFIASWQAAHPDALIIPEGGSQALALPGVAEILSEQESDFSHLLVPVGSGGTLAGLIQARQARHKNDLRLIGVATLKGEGYLEGLVNSLLPDSAYSNWHIEHRFHFGGYAKRSDELINFCDTFKIQTGIAIEPVYSGKTCWALKQLLAEGYFPRSSRILLLHTGGLQGAR